MDYLFLVLLVTLHPLRRNKRPRFFSFAYPVFGSVYAYLIRKKRKLMLCFADVVRCSKFETQRPDKQEVRNKFRSFKPRSTRACLSGKQHVLRLSRAPGACRNSSKLGLQAGDM